MRNMHLCELALALSVISASVAVWAAPTAEVVDGKYVFTVPTGEEYTLTAADVATAMDGGNYACPFAKKGEGTLIVGDVMASYTNAIYVLEGIYKGTNAASFGTAAGVTYVDGGTIWCTLGAPTGDNKPAYGSEAFHLKGTGYNNLGVIHQTDGDCYNFAALGGITLDGDIRVTGTRDLEFRYGSVNCNSNTVTVAMSGSSRFRFVALTVNNPGSVVVESGMFGFENKTGTGDASHSVTLEPGATLYLQDIRTEQKRRLWIKDGARLYVARNGTHVPGQMTTINLWSGDIAVDAVTPVEYRNEGRVFNLAAPISGAGGFSAFGGGYMQFSNTNNTFAGGVCVTGKVGTADGVVTGGVSVIKTTSAASVLAAPFVAIPTNGAPLRIRNAQLGIFNAHYAELPDVYADGRCTVTGDATLVKGTLKSLTKTGSDALTLSGAVNVRGATDVSGGTLRFGTRVPDVPSGLNWYYAWTTSGSFTTNVPSNVPFRGVDPTGVAYAYRSWPSTSGANDTTGHRQCHYYNGFVRIPGEEGDEVTCNFVSCICRYSYVVIGGKTVVYMNDATDKLTGTTFPSWRRLYVGPPVTLTAGWQPISVYFGNFHDSSAGPWTYAQQNWGVSNFGLGVDWSARCVTNSASYVKFLDPGDGSFLRPTLDGKADLDPADYPRPTFEGSVAFGPGTVFDVNDATPYTPVTLPSLTGVPTITNGEVHVTDTTWTLRAEDVAGGVPLTVASGAKLQFAAGTAMALADEGDIPHHSVKTYPVLRVVDGGTLVNAPEYARVRGSKWFAEWSADGKQLDLVYRDGCYLIIR